MIDRFQRFIFDISVIYHHWHRIATEEMRDYGLNGPYAVYFSTLYQYPEGLTAAGLCEISGRDKADVSRAISLMSKKGLVEKVTTGNSVYRARMVLTEEGRRVAEGVAIKATEAVRRGGEGISEEQRNAFYEVLDRIAANLQTIGRKKEAAPQ